MEWSLLTAPCWLSHKPETGLCWVVPLAFRFSLSRVKHTDMYTALQIPPSFEKDAVIG